MVQNSASGRMISPASCCSKQLSSGFCFVVGVATATSTGDQMSSLHAAEIISKSQRRCNDTHRQHSGCWLCGGKPSSISPCELSIQVENGVRLNLSSPIVVIHFFRLAWHRRNVKLEDCSSFTLVTKFHNFDYLLSFLRVTFCLSQRTLADVYMHLPVDVEHNSVHGSCKARNCPVHDPV